MPHCRIHRQRLRGLVRASRAGRVLRGRQHARRRAGACKNCRGLRKDAGPPVCRTAAGGAGSGRGRGRRQARQAGRGAADPHHRELSVPRPARRRSRRAARRAAPPLREKPRALPAVRRLPSQPRAPGRHHRPRRDRKGNRVVQEKSGEPVSALLEVRNLQTRFATEGGEFPAVDGVSFTLEAGGTLGLVGESGCGKSVTALSIMGLVPRPPGRIAGGEILFEGRNLLELDAAGMRALRGERMAMIFQEPMTSLNPAFTIGEQIAEVLLRHKKINRVEAKDRAIEMLRKVRMPSPERRYGDYPHRLSGRMRQRAMIAMALACAPKLLICDEPTTALDVTIQAQILDLMRTLREETGTAIILITHDLGVVAELADEVAVMYAGRIVEHAPVAKLFAEPQHPYTIGLLGSIPKLHVEQARLAAIEGQVPNPMAAARGCRFEPRCPFAVERCGREDPVLSKVTNSHETSSHQAACWRAPL